MTPTTEQTQAQLTLAGLRDQLEWERTSFLESVVATPQTDRPDGGLGETEHLTVDAQRDIDAVLDAMGRSMLRDLNNALDRFDAGTYGTCEVCDESIPLERLEAMPTARCCVQCQASLEPGQH